MAQVSALDLAASVYGQEQPGVTMQGPASQDTAKPAVHKTNLQALTLKNDQRRG
jgi:hypothetical protein